MSDYGNLTSKILSNKILAEAVNDMIDEKTLDLATEDWEFQLENNITFQDFSSHSESLWRRSYATVNYEFEETKSSSLNVVILGHCKLSKPYKGKISKPSVIIMNSDPLNKIARAMLSDLGSNVQISREFKFPFQECSVLSCHDCSQCLETFTKAGYKINQINQPCILDTKAFDGKRVVNRFLSQMDSMFSQTFLAILHLSINSRYSFADPVNKKLYRISGKVLDLVGFHENKLMFTKTVNVGPLANFEMEAVKSSDNPPEDKQKSFLDNVESIMMDGGEIDKETAEEETGEPKTKKIKFAEDSDTCDFLDELQLI